MNTASIRNTNGKTWDVRRAALELHRFEFVARFLARQTRGKKRQEENGLGYRVEKKREGWKIYFGNLLAHEPKSVHALHEIARRTPLAYLIAQAEDLRQDYHTEEKEKAAKLNAANARQAKLEQAWKLADPTCKELDRDWKDPINIYGTELAIDRTCAELGVTLHDVLAAIEHFTATMPTVKRWREHTLAGARMIRITADGYRAGPAGDH